MKAARKVVAWGATKAVSSVVERVAHSAVPKASQKAVLMVGMSVARKAGLWVAQWGLQKALTMAAPLVPTMAVRWVAW